MKKLLLLISVAAGMEATAQSLSPTVISSSGGFFSNTAGMLSSTVAELAAVTTLASASHFLTQGFQQPDDFTIGIPEINSENFYLQAYPNPGNGVFNVGIKSEENFSMVFNVRDILGKIILSQTAAIPKGTFTLPINLTNHAEGIYLLECSFVSNEGSHRRFKTFTKLNLIY